VRFWDSSAVVPLLVAEARTDAAQGLLREDPAMIVWWATPTECASAIARLERDGALSPDLVDTALARLDDLDRGWGEVLPIANVRQHARRLLRTHSLRAADALQLAAALIASEGRPDSLDVVALDDRLRDAARREGFRLLP